MREVGFILILEIAVLLVCSLVFWKFLDKEYVYMFTDVGSDTINIYYPQLMHYTYYSAQEGGTMMWSFYQGMGQNLYKGDNEIPSLMIYVSKFLDLFYKMEYPAERFILIELCKILLTSLYIYLFFRILLNRRVPALLGAFIFTLSGYMILGTSWYAHSNIIMNNAFALLAFEMLFTFNVWILIPLAVYYISFGPYLYFTTTFIGLYLIFRMFATRDKTWKDVGRIVLKLVVFSLLGVALLAPGLVSQFTRVVQSPRLSGASSLIQDLSAVPFYFLESPSHYVTIILRFFSNDILGNGSDYSGWRNYLEAPAFYCGMLTLLLVPQLFYNQPRRKLFIYGALLGFWLFILIFPYFRYAYYLFAGDYYKHAISLFFPATLIIFAMLSYRNILEFRFKVQVPLLLITCAVLLALLFFPYPVQDIHIQQNIQLTAAAFLLIYTVLLLLSNYASLQRICLYALVPLVLLELGIMANHTVAPRQAVKSETLQARVGYNDYTVDAINYLKQTDSTFFRINKEYSSGTAQEPSINDGMVQNYFGTTVYTSFNQKYYIRFLEKLFVIDPNDATQKRWSPGLSTRPFLQSIGTVKYHLTKDNPSAYETNGFAQEAKTFNDVRLLRNKFYLPLGFTYRQKISLAQFERINNASLRDITLFNAFVAENEDLDAFKSYPVYEGAQVLPQNYTLEHYAADVFSPLRDTLRIERHGHNFIRGTIESRAPQFLFFAIPYDKGWRATLDEEEVPLYLANVGFMGMNIPAGHHTVRLKFVPPYSFIGDIIFDVALILYLIGIVLTFLWPIYRKKELIEQQGGIQGEEEFSYHQI
ncbi:MAG: YfhO family protein [Sphingobacteriales bacterium]|nr:YfhO family protein [Sphingobacteriales bacterium]